MTDKGLVVKDYSVQLTQGGVSDLCMAIVMRAKVTKYLNRQNKGCKTPFIRELVFQTLR